MSTTESVESVQSLEVTVDLETVLAALKQFEAADLFKVIKTATQEVEKRVKGSKVKKEDGPKKPTPSQLQKPTAWVRFTLKHAQEHGWEEFIVCNSKSKEEILMPASVEIDGKHVYPNGKEMILTHAMSLSKQYWSPKFKDGTHEELYAEFLEEFNAAVAAEPVEEEEEEEKPVFVRKTAEEKAAEMEAKKAEIEAKKAEKKEEREKAKEEAKAAKEAEKAAAKAAKVPKAAVKVVVKPAAKAPAKVEAKATGKEEAKAPVAPIAEKKIPGKKPLTGTATAAVWSCPADGAVHPWAYKGMAYLRNSDHQVWRAEADGSCGDWCGVYLGGEDRIDDSVEEPDFE